MRPLHLQGLVFTGKLLGFDPLLAFDAIKTRRSAPDQVRRGSLPREELTQVCCDQNRRPWLQRCIQPAEERVNPLIEKGRWSDIRVTKE